MQAFSNFIGHDFVRLCTYKQKRLHTHTHTHAYIRAYTRTYTHKRTCKQTNNQSSSQAVITLYYYMAVAAGPRARTAVDRQLRLAEA